MPYKRQKLLWDILQSGKTIRSFVEGRTRKDYVRDLYFRSAVERQFEIVGEAMRRLAALDAELAARITHHRQIIDFRNFLAHGYDEIDDIAVWHTITADLPRLIAEAEALLAELEDGA